MTRLEPLNDYIMVRRDDPKTRTDNGLEIPTAAIVMPNTGVVVALSEGIPLPFPGKLDIVGELNPNSDAKSCMASLLLSPSAAMLLPHSVAVGDRVLFNSYAGVEVKDPANDGKPVIFLKPADLIAVLRETSNE